METATPHNLFLYPLWLSPEAFFIVRRNEPVYARQVARLVVRRA